MHIADAHRRHVYRIYSREWITAFVFVHKLSPPTSKYKHKQTHLPVNKARLVYLWQRIVSKSDTKFCIVYLCCFSCIKSALLFFWRYAELIPVITCTVFTITNAIIVINTIIMFLISIRSNGIPLVLFLCRYWVPCEWLHLMAYDNISS